MIYLNSLNARTNCIHPLTLITNEVTQCIDDYMEKNDKNNLPEYLTVKYLKVYFRNMALFFRLTYAGCNNECIAV